MKTTTKRAASLSKKSDAELRALVAAAIADLGRAPDPREHADELRAQLLRDWDGLDAETQRVRAHDVEQARDYAVRPWLYR